jgi:mannose-6-phosphate isomerase-like protein (cupin superfamily)
MEMETQQAGYTTASWDKLKDFPAKPLPEDHPWPTREHLALRVYSVPLACEHLAFSIGHLKPGESVEHHTHKQAEEVYVLMKGRSQIRIGDEVIEAKEFDAFRFPHHVPRSVYNHSDEDCWWIFIGAPIDEFLENADYNPQER